MAQIRDAQLLPLPFQKNDVGLVVAQGMEASE